MSMQDRPTTAQGCYQMTGLFEAEVLTRLLLRQFGHPLAEDKEFPNDLLERAAEMLRAAVDGGVQIEGVAAHETNLVAALCEAESRMLHAPGAVPQGAQRSHWVKAIRRAFPSCFAPQNSLPP